MEAAIRRSMLGFAALLGALHVALAASLLVQALESQDGYVAWATVGLAGGVSVLVGLAIMTLRPVAGGMLAYAGVILGFVFWISPSFMFMSWLLMFVILGLTILYHQVRTASDVPLAVVVLLVLLIVMSWLGVLLYGAIATSAVPWIALVAVAMLLPPFGVIMAVRSSSPRTA